jgi:hypothetical protein
MPSIKRLRSVCHSIAHHAVSSVSFIHPHLRKACKAIGIESVSIYLLEEQPCPERFLNIEPLRLALLSLRDRFQEILVSGGFAILDIEAIDLKFEFPKEYPDDYCSNCNARLASKKSGQVFEYAVNYMGQAIHRK